MGQLARDFKRPQRDGPQDDAALGPTLRRQHGPVVALGAQLEPRVKMLRADAIDVLDVEQAVPEALDLAPGVVATARASSQLYIVIE